MSPNTNTLTLMVFIFFISGCSISKFTKSQDPYYSASKVDYFEKITDDLDLKISCIKKDSELFNSDPTKQNNTCVYKSVDESHTSTSKLNNKTAISEYFSKCSQSANENDCTAARNRIIDTLVKISNENCSVFLQDTFFCKINRRRHV